MKKLLFLVLGVVFLLAACGGSEGRLTSTVLVRNQGS